MFNGVFLIILLIFTRSGNRYTKIFIGVLVGLLVQSLWNVYVWKYSLPSHLKLFNYYFWATAFLWGPVLYMYVSTTCNERKPTMSWVMKHCVLALILFVLQLPIHLLLTQGFLRLENFDIFFRFTVMGLYVQMSLYIYACFQALASFDKRVKDHYSNTEKINLKWLKRLTILFAFVIAVDMCFIAPAVIRQSTIPYLTVILLAESLTIYLMAFFSLIHPEILFQNEEQTNKPKYSNSPLHSDLSTELKSKLDSVMTKTQIYKKNDLRLSELAETVGINPHHLSQLINEQYEKNFYEFVNNYRVISAADSLKLSDQPSITHIAFESGFNNRVSFNNAFKKEMGMTPSQFRKQEMVRLEKES